jgi:hypothetical protein
MECGLSQGRISLLNKTTRELGSCADSRPIEDENPGYERKQGTDSTQETGSAAEGEFIIHLHCDEGEDATCALVSKPARGFKSRSE